MNLLFNAVGLLAFVVGLTFGTLGIAASVMTLADILGMFALAGAGALIFIITSDQLEGEI